MFDRKAIKEQAKTLIKRSYWMLVLVVFVAGLLGATIGGSSAATASWDFSSVFDNDDADVQPDVEADYDFTPDTYTDDPFGDVTREEIPFALNDIWREIVDAMGVALPIIIGVLVAVAGLAILTTIAFAIFISNVVTAGVSGWLMRYWRGEDPPFGDLFSTFRTYGAVVKAMFLRDLYTFLWSLLFIIPGVIKGLAYMMVPYIIYENPHLTASQALDVSEKMTDGYKGDLFVLGLSFIGWNMLSALTGGILGIFYVNPYIGLAYAGAYDQLKWNAIQNGRLTWSDFGQMAPAPEWTAPADSTPFYG